MKQRTNATNKSHQNKVRCPRRRLLSVLVTQALSVPLAAQAASVEVTGTADNNGAGCTLREAVATVNAGMDVGNGCTNGSTDAFGVNDEITFGSSVSGGTIGLTMGHLVPTADVAINPGGSQTTIEAGGNSRIFYINTPSVDIGMEALTLTGGAVSGGGFPANTGGAVAIGGGSTLSLNNSTVSGNSADFSGGISAFGSASISLTNSTVSGNSAGYGVGGIGSQGNLSLTNSTVSGNSATNYVGGIYTDGYLSLMNTTVAGNSAGGARGVGLKVDDLATATLTNSIIANSRGDGADCEKDATATVAPVVNSLIEDDACGTTASNADPGLMALADNGGPTETHALKPGSPAIDAGDDSDCGPGLTIETDQRGVARDDGACDIGAYEFAETVTPIAFQDRAMGAVMNGADQWYRFNSMTTQRISTQTNGFGGDTRLELYTGGDPEQPTNLLADDDDAGPEQFSNIRNDVDPGTHLIRVIGNPAADPFFLRLMSAEDILSFTDTGGHFAETAIGVMSAAGITGGCGSGMYCPDDPVTRAQMALFMLRAIQGGNQSSPAATGNVFGDVGPNSFAANAIEEFSTLGITAGCGGGNYCPDDPVTREQMAIFLLRALFGAGHTPPQATPAEINQFTDISDSFAQDWIVQLVDEGITGGCGGNQFCPADPVTRGQMAAFIQRTFDLDVNL